MAGYVVRRLLQLAAVLLGTSLILFVCLFVVPGDPLQTIGGGRTLDPTTRATLARRYSLDRPLPVQYVLYVSRLARGDLGESYSQRRPVNEFLREKAGSTLRLALAALACEILLGVAAGTVAAVCRRSFLDVAVTVATTVAIAVPVFVIGLGALELFATRLHWAHYYIRHPGGRELILPALTLGAANGAVLTRIMRAVMVEVLGKDYIRTARANGLPPRSVVLRHALANAAVPGLTYAGLTLGGMLGGAVLTESVFNWDGLGRAVVNAITVQDNPVVMGVVLYSLVAFVVVNLMVDVACAAFDPRLRLRR